MSNENITTKLNYAIHPGEILQDALDEHQLSQKDLAARIDVTPKHINEIIKGKSSITSTIAQKLEFIFSTSPGYWLTLQKNYEEILARLSIDEQFDNEKQLIDEFPCYKDLVKYGYVKETRDKKEKYIELLNFFSLSSLKLLQRNYDLVMFRKGDQAANSFCMAAWLRIGEIHFRSAGSPLDFDEKAFKDKLIQIRSYTSEPIESASKKLQRDCFELGVTVAYTPYLKNTYINGATRWFAPTSPYIQMTARMKRSDIFWFTFFHEAAHILKHSKKKSYVEWEGNHSEDPDEIEANIFAANFLIPPTQYKQFIKRDNFSDAAIKTFAGSIGVGSDIVAGRLAREKRIEWKDAMKFIKGIEVRPATNGV